MIDLDEPSLSFVRKVLALHVPGFEVRMFGSRVRSTARKYSDIDLVIVGKEAVPERQLSELKDAFAESNLPYRVDVVDWHAVTPEFRAAVEQQGFEVVQHG